MTQRLRMACMGLSAFWLPACSGLLNHSTESDFVQTGPAYVVANRPNGPYPPGSRTQIVERPRTDNVLAKQTKDAPRLVTYPTASEGIQNAGRKQLITVPPPDAPVVPPPISGVESLLGKSRNPWGADTQIKAPPWPNFGGLMDDDASIAVTNASSKLEIPTIDGSTQSPGVLPDLVQPPDSASLKIPGSESASTAPVEASLIRPVSKAPASTDETLLVRAVKALQNNRPEEAAAHFKKLEPVNQEALLDLLPLLVRLSEGSLNALPPEELSLLIDRLNTVSGMLKSKASLRAERVSFCRGVRKFADIDPYDARHEFRPGDMVFLYTELKNFTCEPVAGQNPQERGCHIRLGTTLELRDARNSIVWRTDLNKTDFAQTPPQDYYHTYRFCVPDKLPAGIYTLWLNIVDKPTGRTVRKPIEMRIGQS